MTRAAAIDIGTNSIKLLVGDIDSGIITPLLEESKTTRLGEGAAETRALSPGAMERTIGAIAAQANRARSMNATRIYAAATSCVRESHNRDEFVQAVRATAGVEVEVISGEREAEMIFAGVGSQPAFRKLPLLVMDVGGGSAEFIIGEDSRLAQRMSIPAGAVRLTERFLHKDPPSDHEIDALVAHLRELMLPIFAHPVCAGRTMVGTGGAITTAAAMDQELVRFAIEKINNYTLTHERLKGLLERCMRLPLAEREKLAGLPQSRADIIIAGLAAFLVAMQLGNYPQLAVSTRGLRFGLLMEKSGESDL